MRAHQVLIERITLFHQVVIAHEGLLSGSFQQRKVVWPTPVCEDFLFRGHCTVIENEPRTIFQKAACSLVKWPLHTKGFLPAQKHSNAGTLGATAAKELTSNGPEVKRNVNSIW